MSLNTFGILAYNLAVIIWPNNITMHLKDSVSSLLLMTCFIMPSIRPNHRFLQCILKQCRKPINQIPSDPFLCGVGPEGGTYRNTPKKLPCHKIPSIFQPKIWCGKDWQRIGRLFWEHLIGISSDSSLECLTKPCCE